MLTKSTLDKGISTISAELEESLNEFSRTPCWSIARGIKDLSESIMYLRGLSEEMFESEEDAFDETSAKDWVSHMITVKPDGSKVQGEHWTIDQTTTVANKMGVKWTHITPYCFWVVMNMLYSDYSNVAIKHGVDTVEFYVDMTKAFLFDEDSIPPKKKVSEYYHHIVKPAMH